MAIDDVVARLISFAGVDAPADDSTRGGSVQILVLDTPRSGGSFSGSMTSGGVDGVLATIMEEVEGETALEEWNESVSGIGVEVSGGMSAVVNDLLDGVGGDSIASTIQ